MSNCPHCLVPGRVLQTRKDAAGNTTYRRYICVTDPKIRYSTREVNEMVINAIGAKRFAQLVATTQRGAERRSLAELRKRRVSQMIAKGTSVPDIARELAITPARVHQICQALGLAKTPRSE